MEKRNLQREISCEKDEKGKEYRRRTRGVNLQVDLFLALRVTTGVPWQVKAAAHAPPAGEDELHGEKEMIPDLSLKKFHRP
jgi:hypothetical protein